MNITLKPITFHESLKFLSPKDRREALEDLVTLYYNPRKYTLLGFLDKTNMAVLRERFYNIRDRRGRFAKIYQKKPYNIE